MTEPIHRNSLSRATVALVIIGRVLGQGGFGVTYLAHDFNLNHEVAIKEYLPIGIAVREQDSFRAAGLRRPRRAVQMGIECLE